MKAIGFVLIVVGLLGLAWGGFSYTRKEKVVDLGPVDISKEKKESVPIPPVAGLVAVVVGGILVVKDRG